MIWVAKKLYFFNCLLDGAHTNVVCGFLFLYFFLKLQGKGMKFRKK